MDRDVYEKELQLLLQRLKEVAFKAAEVKESNMTSYEEKERHVAMEMNKLFEIPKSAGNGQIVTILSLVVNRCTRPTSKPELS